MNHIAEENENQEMNTEQVETQEAEFEARETESDTEEAVNMPEEEDVFAPDKEITGEETMEELLGIYESSLKKFEEGQVVTGTVISVGKIWCWWMWAINQKAGSLFRNSLMTKAMSMSISMTSLRS
jgi:small subunit ribosomal protein S1